jgi:hypothetical protein
MSFTRFHDDPNRIQKQVLESSYAGRYALEMPGNGVNMPFLEDVQVRIQKWGANRMNQTVNLESDLRGLTRILNRDRIDENEYHLTAVAMQPISYPNATPFVGESRASHPAWMYRDLEQPRWEEPWLNPLANLEKPFYDNIQTRIIEKDNFRPRIPIIQERL